MMETIALGGADSANNQTLHVVPAEGIDDCHRQHSPASEDQMMNLTDMTDLSQEDMQDGLVTIPKEVILISLVSQEHALYNPKHEHYRNTQRKDIKWTEIAEQVGWSETQCKAKWKAMRDQYCRELKRPKFNAKTNVKWKYFKELDFLRPYALARNYRPRNPISAFNTSSNVNSSSNSSGNNISIHSVSAAASSDIKGHGDNSNTKFATIKIENTHPGSFTNCAFSAVKGEAATSLSEDHLSTVLHHQTDDNNWTYITGSSTSSNNNSRLENHSLSDTTHLLSSTHTDEALINAWVDCVGQIQQPHHPICHNQSSEQQAAVNSSNHDEEDDDPIHTFLNIESYFEKDLIALIQNEDVLYNTFHPNYRNVKMKLEVWDEIARKLKKTVKHCRLKWKALRDQYIREHKRLKNRENVESLPRWKHYDALSFLQKFVKHKAGDFDGKHLIQISKTEMDADMDDEEDHMNISGTSPLRSPLDNMKCELSHSQLQIPELDSVPSEQQHHTGHSENLCVAPRGIGAYDDMDIDNYIMADSGSVVDDHHDHDDQEQGTPDEQKSQQDFPHYANHSVDEGPSPSLDTPHQTVYRPTRSPPVLQPAPANDSHQSQPAKHISMPSLDLSDNVHLMPTDGLKGSPPTANPNFHASNISNGLSIHLASNLELCRSSNLVPPPSTSEASTNTLQVFTGANSSCVNNDEDEVGAFFKAVAMKIRSAKLSPVAFTELQIDILKVINGSLRNH